jgi:hypothetical protein
MEEGVGKKEGRISAGGFIVRDRGSKKERMYSFYFIL